MKDAKKKKSKEERDGQKDRRKVIEDTLNKKSLVLNQINIRKIYYGRQMWDQCYTYQVFSPSTAILKHDYLCTSFILYLNIFIVLQSV